MGLCKKSHVGNVVCSVCGFGLFSYKNENYFHTLFALSKNSQSGILIGKPVQKDSIIRILDSSGLAQIACGKCQSVIGEEKDGSDKVGNNKAQQYKFLEGSVTYVPWKF